MLTFPFTFVSDLNLTLFNERSKLMHHFSFVTMRDLKDFECLNEKGNAVLID